MHERVAKRRDGAALVLVRMCACDESLRTTQKLTASGGGSGCTMYDFFEEIAGSVCEAGKRGTQDDTKLGSL